jgi:hypothetical protein
MTLLLIWITLYIFNIAHYFILLKNNAPLLLGLLIALFYSIAKYIFSILQYLLSLNVSIWKIFIVLLALFLLISGVGGEDILVPTEFRYTFKDGVYVAINRQTGEVYVMEVFHTYYVINYLLGQLDLCVKLPR